MITVRKIYIHIELALLGSILLAPALVSALLGGMGAAVAQIRTCQPPKAGEYLLLVVSSTLESQTQVRRALPSNINSTVCSYLNNEVTRIGGFTNIEDANGWQRYVRDVVGLPAYIAQGPRATSPSIPPSNPQPQPTLPSDSPSYSPQPLGAGYAVLVDYFSQPKIADQVQQLLGRDVGLVSYGQRPYLLAIHTSSQNTATLTLRKLSDRGLFAVMVDSSKVTLLRSRVLNLD